MKLGEKEYNDRDKPTIVTDAWLHFTASGKFPLLTSLDLTRCNNVTEAGLTETDVIAFDKPMNRPRSACTAINLFNSR